MVRRLNMREIAVAVKNPRQSQTLLYSRRHRMRSKIIDDGPDSFTDLELLECLLFFSFRRRDAQLVARRLLRHYGSLVNVIERIPIEPAFALNMTRIDTSVMTIVKMAATRLTQASAKTLHPLHTWEAIEAYLKDNDQPGDTRDEIRSLFLDNKKNLLADERVMFRIGGPVEIGAQLLKRGILSKASLIILVRAGDNVETACETLAQVAIRMAAASETLSITFVVHVRDRASRLND